MPRLTLPGKRATPTLERRWRAEIDDHVIALAWSPDGRTLAAAAVSGPITIYDAATGAARVTLAGHDFGTTAISWSACGRHFASAGQDGMIRLWDLEAGAPRLELRGGAAWVERLAWTPAARQRYPANVPRGKNATPAAPPPSVDDAPLLASAAGRVVRLWDTDGALVREWNQHSSTVADLAWKPGARLLAVATYGGLTLYLPEAEEARARYQWQGSTLVIAWSPDGAYIATGDQDSTVHFWYAATGEDLQMWGYPTKVRELAWDPASRWLATGGGADVTVWNCSGKGPAGTRPLQLQAHDDRVSALAWQARGALLASGGADGLVILWRPDRGTRSVAETGFNVEVTALAWSPDDRMLAVGTATGSVALHSAP